MSRRWIGLLAAALVVSIGLTGVSYVQANATQQVKCTKNNPSTDCQQQPLGNKCSWSDDITNECNLPSDLNRWAVEFNPNKELVVDPLKKAASQSVQLAVCGQFYGLMCYDNGKPVAGGPSVDWEHVQVLRLHGTQYGISVNVTSGKFDLPADIPGAYLPDVNGNMVKSQDVMYVAPNSTVTVLFDSGDLVHLRPVAVETNVLFGLMRPDGSGGLARDNWYYNGNSFSYRYEREYSAITTDPGTKISQVTMMPMTLDNYVNDFPIGATPSRTQGCTESRNEAIGYDAAAVYAPLIVETLGNVVFVKESRKQAAALASALASAVTPTAVAEKIATMISSTKATRVGTAIAGAYAMVAKRVAEGAAAETAAAVAAINAANTTAGARLATEVTIIASDSVASGTAAADVAWWVWAFLRCGWVMAGGPVAVGSVAAAALLIAGLLYYQSTLATTISNNFCYAADS